MRNRCMNDLFGYCAGDAKPISITSEYIVIGKPNKELIAKGKQKTTADGQYIVEDRSFPACTKDQKSCGGYITATEELSPIVKMLDELRVSKGKEISKRRKVKK